MNRQAKNLLAAALCATALSISAAPEQALPPDGLKVKSVEISGLHRVSPADVERVMEMKEGGTWSRETLRRDLQAITNLGTVNPVSIDIQPKQVDGGVVLVVKVEENPVIHRINVIGNVKYNGARIKSEIDFKEGDILPTGARSRTIRNLRSFYATGGFKSTDVKVVIEPATEEGQVDVLITIDEGEKIKIKTLVINGNKHFMGQWLKTKLSNTGSWLIFDNYYDDAAFEDDLKIIEKTYRDAGYFDVVAKRGDFQYNSDKAWISPVINITEGPRYKVREVVLESGTLFGQKELLKDFVRMKGSYFDGDRFHDATEALRKMYGNEGYVNADFDTRFEKLKGQGLVDLHVKIVENDVVYVGNISIKRQEYEYQFDLNPLEEVIDWTSPGTKEETVRREVRLKTGQKYRTTDEVRTVERLRNLGFFESVNVRRIPTEDPSTNDVEVEVKDSASAGYLTATAGYGQHSGPAVTLGYSNPNLFGEAKVFKASATWGPNTQGYHVGYLDRHWRGTDDTMEYALGRDVERWPGYTDRTYSFMSEYGHPETEYVTNYARLRLEDINFSQTSRKAHENWDSYQAAALRVNRVVNHLDNNKWPTRGYYMSNGVEAGYARGAMLKFLHSYEWYKSVGHDFVYAYRHNVGISPYNADHVGITERFFLGGGGNLRGFASHGVGPVDRGDRQIHTGGSTMLTQSHELRYPFTKYFRGKIFVDAGLLSNRPLAIGAPRASSGVGFSVDLGPVTVDVNLAAALVKKSTDRTQIMTFSVGSSF